MKRYYKFGILVLSIGIILVISVYFFFPIIRAKASHVYQDKRRGFKYFNYTELKEKEDTILVSANYTYIAYSKGVSKEEIEELDKLNDKSFTAIQSLFGTSFKPAHINYFIYDTFEEKGLITNNTSLSNFDETNKSVHTVINNYVQGDDYTQDAILLLRKNFGQPKMKFLETGLSIYLGRNWRGLDYRYWASKLFLSDNVPELRNLLNNETSKSESNLLTEPLAGTFAAFLIQKFGINALMRKYANWDPNESEINKLNKEWKEYLIRLSAAYKGKIAFERNNFQKEKGVFLKGFSYAHVGYNIYNGYLSKESFESLKELKKIGVNSISIMPFTSMANPNKPEPFKFWQSAFAENDESLIFLKEAAIKLSFVVMLKPQIWIRHGWPGDIRMENKVDWREFFKDYYRWIRHYAILAEIYKIPILCIGNELSQTTVGHEKAWIKMAEQIRKFYDGKITYGANWDNEFEKLNFWKYFDYIGISQYYPLSDKAFPTDEDLETGAVSVINRIDSIREKFNIPVLFTEIGYKSTKAPWKTALEKDDIIDTNYSNQARCYDAILKACYGKKWLAGIFWWKWPSYLSYGDNSDRHAYNIIKKPAEEVVKKWYSKRWN